MNGLDSVSSILVSKLLDLLSLLVGNVVALLDLSIDDLLVLDVDEGAKESDEGGDQRQSPKRNELDKEVGHEGCEESLEHAKSANRSVFALGWCTYSNCDVDVLGEDDALRLNHEEVDELLNIVCQALERSLGDGEVLARPELGSESLANSQLSRSLRSSGDSKCHPRSLEDVPDQVQVSGSEDKDHDCGESDTGRSGVLPAQKPVEEAVVVLHVVSCIIPSSPRRKHTGKVLAGGRLVVWDGASICEISKLVTRLCALCLHGLSYWACKI